MAKSWLEIQVDLELARSQSGRMEQLKSYGDSIDGSPEGIDSTSQPGSGPENWPLQVLNQQPRDLSALLRKLHSGYFYNVFFANIKFSFVVLFNLLYPFVFLLFP